MKKITQEMINAYLEGKEFYKSNTEVIINPNSSCGTLTQIYLFNNCIAENSDLGLYITNQGWFTKTTKERLNALPGVSIFQKNRKWFLNGKQWNGEWIKIG